MTQAVRPRPRPVAPRSAPRAVTAEPAAVTIDRPDAGEVPAPVPVAPLVQPVLGPLDVPTPQVVAATATRPAVLVMISRIPNLGINTGIALTVLGGLLIFAGWGRAAGLAVPGQQIPYLLGAGLPGLGLVIVGMSTINLTVRRNDAATRHRQIVELTELLEQLSLPAVVAQQPAEKDEQS